MAKKPSVPARKKSRASTSKSKSGHPTRIFGIAGPRGRKERKEAAELLKTRKQIEAMSNSQLYDAISTSINSGAGKDSFVGSASKILIERGRTCGITFSIKWHFPDRDDETKSIDAFKLITTADGIGINLFDQQAMKFTIALTHDELVQIYRKIFD